MTRRNEFEKKRLNWRVVLLTALPLVLAGVTWKLREELKPVMVKLGPQKIQSRVLFERMNVEAHTHHYARTIDVNWSQPWPKESGLDLFTSQNLTLDRSQHTLFYATDQYGWVYSQVEDSGLEVLAKAQLQNDPITLPASVHAQLRARGWTLTEHYLP